MARKPPSEDDLREFDEGEALLERPVLSEQDITDDLLHVLAETGAANFVLNIRRPGVQRPALPPRSAIDRAWPTDLRLEQEYGIDGLDGFEDRKGLLKDTLAALLQRGRVNVSTVVKILRAAKNEAAALAVTRIVERPSAIRRRVAIRKNLEKSAKVVLNPSQADSA